MAQVTTTDIRTRIKAMLDTYVTFFASGTGDVFADTPLAVHRANLPALLILNGAGSYNNNTGSKELTITRNFPLLLLHQELSTETTINITSTQIDLMTTEVEDMFITYSQLMLNNESLKGVRNAKLTTISDIRGRNYPQVENAPVYVSLQWQLQVIYNRFL